MICIGNGNIILLRREGVGGGGEREDARLERQGRRAVGQGVWGREEGTDERGTASVLKKCEYFFGRMLAVNINYVYFCDLKVAAEDEGDFI